MRKLAILGAALLAVPSLAQTPAKPLSAYKGDPVAGAKLFTTCKTCHSAEAGKNMIGPSLFGIVGRQSGSVKGYTYSAANLASKLKWTPDNLFTYLANPRKMIPGTKMTYAGLPDPQKRANLIAYLATLK